MFASRHAAGPQNRRAEPYDVLSRPQVGSFERSGLDPAYRAE